MRRTLTLRRMSCSLIQSTAAFEGAQTSTWGRAVDNGDFLCLDDPLDGVLLAAVEPGEGEGWEGAECGLCVACQHIAQSHEALVLFPFGFSEGLLHDAVAGVVHSQLHADEVALRQVLEALQGGFRGQADAHHAVAHSLDIALVRQLFGRVPRQVEQRHRLAGLEVELHLVLLHLIAQLEGELSQGVVGGVAEAHGVAAGRLVDAARQRSAFGGKAPLVGLLLLAKLQRHQFAQMAEVCADVHHVMLFFSDCKSTKKNIFCIFAAPNLMLR